jgi:cytochrome P450
MPLRSNTARNPASGAAAVQQSVAMAAVDLLAAPLIGEAPPSPAGPIDAGEAARLPRPPVVALPSALQLLRFNQRQIQFVFRARRELGEVFTMRGRVGPIAFTCHPDHARSLFTADAELAPSLTGQSPVRPVVGASSVLTSLGETHMRQRRMLLPFFRGEAVERYTESIADVAERSIDSWPLNEPFALAPRMQDITLDVIMAGIFGIEGEPARGTPEHALRDVIRRLLAASTLRVAQLGELMQIGREEPFGALKGAMSLLDRRTYAVIEERRRADDLEDRSDILSRLLGARDDDGEPLSDRELRDQLVTLVLAGHETTANQLAWTWERLVRAPRAYERLCEAVRSDSAGAAEEIEAVIQEGMRCRPVVPMVGRLVQAPWRLGSYAVDAETPVGVSVLLLHHREDLYPDPFAFRPERWHGHKPGTYEWIPFGGGIRRCLGATLAMAEQRVVIETMVRRLDVRADRSEPEHAHHRNVTMIPARGATVVIAAKH